MEIDTVGDLVKALLAYDQEAPVKICTSYPFHRSIETVEVPAPNITASCVAIYA